VAVRAIDPDEVAARMVHSLAFERGELVARSYEYRYAFPGRSCASIDGAAALEASRLRAMLADVPALALDHPYPVELDALWRTLAPRIEGG
jgi:hypothetical protein